MAINYAEGLFVIVNTFLAFYIIIYAFVFLLRTKNYPDRKPWELLFVGAIFFLINQVFAISGVYGIVSFFGVSVIAITAVLQFIYVALVLMAFITQSHLILRSDMILITKKVQERKEEDKKTKLKTKTHKDFLKLNKNLTPDEEIKFEIGKKELEKEMEEEHFESEIKSEGELVEEDK
ncbi:hypothetical protein HQ533_05885 [Candidatus Woesearchaeota archaeon]|nr:hypothetical protein [Candidatus Woesearchaeota archaeon]